MLNKILQLFFFLLSSIMVSAQSVTVLESSSIWSYLEGNSSISNDWMEQGYDDSTWETGNGGIGYGDNDDNTQLPDAQSVYMRQEFTLYNLDDINELSLFASYDDGFVAYLNGVEIARSNLDEEFPSYLATTTNYKEPELPEGLRPAEFKLNNTTLNSILKEGNNLLAVQTHNYGDNSSDLSSNYWLIGNYIGNDNNYLPIPDWYSVGSFDSDLPIIKIESTSTIEDEPKVNATITVLHNPDNLPNNSISEDIDYTGNIAIEKRGQSSLFFFPKVGYGFETRDSIWNDLDVELLGFPAEEDWVLHGPYSDKTLIRNILAMDIANNMDQYASRTQPVELIINEQYLGIYILMEKIKRDKNRVDIAKLTETDTSGVELTGGYVFKVDKGDPDWISTYDMFGNPGVKVTYQYVSPNRNKILPQQAEYIQSYVDSFEIALRNPAYNFGGKSIDQYIDINSFADHYIIGELTRNVDAFRISTYLHKEKDTDGGLLKMGPVWDFNLGFGNADYCDGWVAEGTVLDNGCSNENPFWWYRLLEYGPYVNAVKCRYKEYRDTFLEEDNLMSTIDQHVESLSNDARERDGDQWMTIGQYVWPNFFVGQSYDQEVENLKSFLVNRLDYLDSVWGDGCILSDIEEIKQENSYTLSPNPASNYFTLESHEYCDDCILFITDINGKLIHRQPILNHYETVELSTFKSGIYIVSIKDANSKTNSRSKLIVE